ncbi:LOW QUALITY PROTEIN: hypothetical protein PanWU01x14_041020 [Parasponia andersonii]|uniref:Uncharacterized protein n=1 Tax=Parasponia andersonii TaxID=3476 RepID=A0A2P5DQB7_PARAD|nr:LOW QUALITY PROTEIN: hypothetical protein PanWU01x14_041020 [Parasponia andersonii]
MVMEEPLLLPVDEAKGKKGDHMEWLNRGAK